MKKNSFWLSAKMLFLVPIFFMIVYVIFFYLNKASASLEFEQLIKDVPAIGKYGFKMIERVKKYFPTYGALTGVILGIFYMIWSGIIYLIFKIIRLSKWRVGAILTLIIGIIPFILFGGDMVYFSTRFTALSSGIILYLGYPLWYTSLILGILLILLFFKGLFTKISTKKISMIFFILGTTMIISGCNFLNQLLGLVCEYGSDKTHCYQEQAVGSGDTKNCDKVPPKEGFTTSNPPKDKCHLMIAENSSDLTACDGMKGGLSSYTKKECQENVLKNNDPDKCINAKDEQVCRDAYAEKTGDCGTGYEKNKETETCDKIGDKDIDPECSDPTFTSQCQSSHSVLICSNGKKHIKTCEFGCFEATCRKSEGKTDIKKEEKEEIKEKENKSKREEEIKKKEQEQEEKENKKVADELEKQKKEAAKKAEEQKEKEEIIKKEEKKINDKDKNLKEEEKEKEEVKKDENKLDKEDKKAEETKKDEEKKEKCTGIQRFNPFCSETHDDIEDKVEKDLKTIKDAASGKYMELLEKSILSETDPSKIRGLEAYRDFLKKSGETMDSIQTTAQTLRNLKRIFLDSYDPSMDIKHMPVDKILKKGIFDRISDAIFGGPKTEKEKEMAEAEDSLAVYEAMLNRQAEIDFLKKKRLNRLGEVVGEGSKQWFTGKLSEKAQDVAGKVAGKAMIAVSVVDYALTSFQDEAKKQMFIGLSRAYNRRRADIQKSNPKMSEEEIHKKTIEEVKDSPYQDAKGLTFIKYGNILENADCQKGTGNQLCIDNRVFWTSMGKAYEHTHRDEIFDRFINK